MKQISSTGNSHQLLSKTLFSNIRVATLILVGILVCGSWGTDALAEDAKINCDAHRGACRQSSGNLTVSLKIDPRPVKAMQDLVFKVSIQGVSPSEPPYIDLGMPAMKMGPNQVALKSTGPGTWEGTGVIVRCPSGKRTWFANVIVPQAGEVQFIFDVIY